MKKKNIISLLSVILVAVLGTIFTQLGMQWFENLKKPTQWIPSFVIPIVWSVIYISVIIVLFLWQNKKAFDNRKHCFVCNKWLFKCFMVLSFFHL